jgi:hypothetical protein
MNRIQRIAAAAAISTAALAPVTAAVAYAEPYPWHNPNGDSSQPSGPAKTKAQIEYEERLQLGPLPGTGNEEPPSQPTSDATGFPWETVGLAALGAGVLAAGGVVVARRSHREPRPA